jgi:cytochrome c556
MKRLISIGLAAALSVASFHAVAAEGPPSPEDQAKASVETRQGLFKVMAFSYRPVGGMLRNQTPFDAAAAQKAAERVVELGAFIPDVFTADTRKFPAIKTAALEGIWGSQADFKVKADDLVKAATVMVAAAKTGDKDATLKAAGAVGKACGGCHDQYRAK